MASQAAYEVLSTLKFRSGGLWSFLGCQSEVPLCGRLSRHHMELLLVEDVKRGAYATLLRD